jgi:hypothetical protein
MYMSIVINANRWRKTSEPIPKMKERRAFRVLEI